MCLTNFKKYVNMEKLETILSHFGAGKKVCVDGKTLTAQGEYCYNKLISVIYELAELGIITDSECQHIIIELDEIKGEYPYGTEN